MERVCIFSKDVIRITGVRLRTAQKILQEIRIFFKKSKREFVTVREFAQYTGIDIDSIDLQ